MVGSEYNFRAFIIGFKSLSGDLKKKRHVDVIFNSIISIPLESALRDEDSLNCLSVAYKPLSIDS